jgi:8-oxo-dGTP pyrophosphatase MutT (NUDIX family)
MNVRYDMVACYVVRPGAEDRPHEFLQILRAEADYMGGTWQTVYGTAAPDEPLWQAAARELREETGLAPVEFYRLATVRSFYTPHNDTVWHVSPFCAVVKRSAALVLNDEHTAVRWVPRDAAVEGFMWATDRETAAEICRDVLDAGPAKRYLRIDLAPPA